MFVADQPAVVAPADTEPMDVIEVIASRPGQAQKIDRRAYRVKQNPQSAQFNGIQLLRGLPAVTITPDDQVMLLGAAGVTFLVDARPVQGDPIAYLRTLRGGDIERIEIMTNPSAQYAAGTGGLINIVLRKKREDGLSGSANVEASTRGNVQGGTSIKSKDGKLTYDLEVQSTAGQTDRWTFRKLRSVQQVEGGPSTINREVGGGHTSQYNGFVKGKLSYDLDARTVVAAEALGGAGYHPTRGYADFIGLTPDFDSFSEQSRSGFDLAWGGLQLTLDRKGKKEGGSLKAGAAIFGNPLARQPLISESSDGGRFSSTRGQTTFFLRANVDWVRPIGKDQILSLGADISRVRNPFDYDFSSNDKERFGPDSRDGFTARELSGSAYGTFQRRFGTWTVMPGIRLDAIDRMIASTARPSTTLKRAYLSPTLHVEHPLTKTLNMTLSYSRRTVQPGYEQISPYAIVTGPLAIQQGNPRLRPERTAAYELNLHYSRKSLEVGLILFNRRTTDLRSNVYTVNEEGLNVFMPVNVGTKTDRGAQFDITSPLFKRVKGTASINLFSSRTPIFPFEDGLYASTFRYTGNATVEWHGKQDGKRPGDIVQVQLTYQSPYRDYQFRDPSYTTLGVAYTHSFSPTLSVTGNLSGLGSLHNKHRLVAPLVQEFYDKRVGPEFKLKLVKTLGKTN